MTCYCVLLFSWLLWCLCALYLCIWIYIRDHLVVSFSSCCRTSSSPAIVNLIFFNHHQFCADFNFKAQRKRGPKQSRGHGDWSRKNLYFFCIWFWTASDFLLRTVFDGVVPFWIFLILFSISQGIERQLAAQEEKARKRLNFNPTLEGRFE